MSNILKIEQTDKIINLYLNHLKTISVISKELNIDKGTISRVLKRNNIKIRKPYKLTNIDKENIKTLYLNGYTTKHIGDIYSLSHATIGVFLKSINIIRTSGDSQKLIGVKKKKGRKKPIDIEKIKNLYNNGWTLKEISKIENYSITQLWFILKEEKIELRKTKTQRHKERIIKTLTGLDYSEYIKKLPEYIKYKKSVIIITNKQKITELPNHNKRGISGVNGAYQLDHKYSILEGFKNNISPEIIGNITNLEFIPWEQNRLKHANCSITIEELYQKYNNTNNKLND